MEPTKNLLKDMRNAHLSKAGSGAKGHVFPSRLLRMHRIGLITLPAPTRTVTKLRIVITDTSPIFDPAWINCSNLASRLLARIARELSDHEYNRYRIRPVLLETFVDNRFSRNCYHAANWINVG